MHRVVATVMLEGYLVTRRNRLSVHHARLRASKARVRPLGRVRPNQCQVISRNIQLARQVVRRKQFERHLNVRTRRPCRRLRAVVCAITGRRLQELEQRAISRKYNRSAAFRQEHLVSLQAALEGIELRVLSQRLREDTDRFRLAFTTYDLRVPLRLSPYDGRLSVNIRAHLGVTLSALRSFAVGNTLTFRLHPRVHALRDRIREVRPLDSHVNRFDAELPQLRRYRVAHAVHNLLTRLLDNLYLRVESNLPPQFRRDNVNSP